MIETKYKFWRVVGSSIIYLFFAGLLIFEFFFENSDFFDFEGFEFYEFLIKPIFYLPLLYLGFRNLVFNPKITFDKSGINFKRIKDQFIPSSEIKGFSINERGLSIIATKQSFFLRKSHVKNFEEITALVENNYPTIQPGQNDGRCRTYMIFFLALLVISTILIAFEARGKLYWLKEKLPLKQIEVSTIEGTLSSDMNNKIYREFMKLRLMEYPDFQFSYPLQQKLKDEVNLTSKIRIPYSDKKVSLKIRTNDLKKLHKDSLGDYQKIRFYELTVENELLLRKKHIIDAK